MGTLNTPDYLPGLSIDNLKTRRIGFKYWGMQSCKPPACVPPVEAFIRRCRAHGGGETGGMDAQLGDEGGGIHSEGVAR